MRRAGRSQVARPGVRGFVTSGQLAGTGVVVMSREAWVGIAAGGGIWELRSDRRMSDCPAFQIFARNRWAPAGRDDPRGGWRSGWVIVSVGDEFPGGLGGVDDRIPVWLDRGLVRRGPRQ